MDYIKPHEVVKTMLAAGHAKAALSVKDLLIRGFLSGALLGFATSLALTAVSCGCKPTPAAPTSAEPSTQEPTMSSTSSSISPDAEVRNAADRDAKNGEMVELFGTYEQVSVGKAPDAPLDGHAAVRLEDGSLVHLQPPWHPDSVRSAEELAKYSDKPVVAKGLLVTECPPPPDNRAYMKVPCLMMGIVVMDRGTYDALKSGVLE